VTEQVLISPLGFSAGAVSGVYFALKEKETNIGRVITVGTAHQGVRDAAAILDSLFRRLGDVAYKACYIDAEEMRGTIGDASGPFAARMGLYIQHARDAKQVVHVAVTGGRSGMGALAALAAQVYHANHLYHLWVDEEIERGGADLARVRPDQENPYINPTVKGENAWCLVPLPFIDLSDLVRDAEKYRRSGQVPEGWTADRLVGEGPAMFESLLHYIPAGLTIASAQGLLKLIDEWRENIEWIKEDDPTKVVSMGKIDRGLQEAIWHRVLSILYTAGALDDESRRNLRRLMSESIAGDFAQRRLQEAAEKDDTGILAWLKNPDNLLELVPAVASVATVILKVVELNLKSRGMI
jgi:hypothetical protein